MSEIKKFREQLEIQARAMKQALEGPQVKGRHDIIDAQYGSFDPIMEQLAQEVGEEEANRILCQTYVKFMG